MKEKTSIWRDEAYPNIRGLQSKYDPYNSTCNIYNYCICGDILITGIVYEVSYSKLDQNMRPQSCDAQFMLTFVLTNGGSTHSVYPMGFDTRLQRRLLAGLLGMFDGSNVGSN